MDKNRATTVYFLQKALQREIERLTEDLVFKQPGTDKPGKLRAFRQQLPIPERGLYDPGFESFEIGDEQDIYPFPWCVIKVDGGSVAAPGEAQKTKLILVIGIYDDDRQQHGHEDVLLVIERIMERFAKEPLLEHKFTNIRLDDREWFRWTLQDAEDDTYPYYFGALELAFSMPGFQREDSHGYA